MSTINNSSGKGQLDLRKMLNSKLQGKFNEELKQKYEKLEDLSKDYILSIAADSSANQVGLPLAKELESFLDGIKDLFEEGFLEDDLTIDGTLFVNRIECGEIAVTTSNNLNITKVIESVFGDAASEDPNLNIIDLIGSQDLKLKNQTISDSLLEGCTFRGGTLVDVTLPEQSQTATLATVNISNEDSSLLQILGIIGTGFGESNNKINIIKSDYDKRSSTYSNIDALTTNTIKDFPSYVSSFTRVFYNKLPDELFNADTGYENPKDYPLVNLRNEKVGLPVSERNNGESGSGTNDMYSLTNANPDVYADDLFAIRIGATLNIGATKAIRETKTHDNVLLYFPPNSEDTGNQAY